MSAASIHRTLRRTWSRTGAVGVVAVCVTAAGVVSLPAQGLRAVTQPSTAVHTDNAALNGMVLPGSNPCVAWFEWGTSSQYGNTAGLTNLAAGGRVVALRCAVIGLSSDFVYHYRLVASNNLGVVYGSRQQFTTGGNIVVWGNPNFGHTTVPDDLTNAVAVSGGSDHCLALRNDGTIAAWGGNYYGQTDIPPDVVEAIAIAGGQYHTLALLPDGTVRAWGAGTTFSQTFPEGGQSIVPPGLSNVVQIAAGTSHSLALKADGTVAAWGSARLYLDVWNDLGQSKVPVGLSNVVAISGGDFHSLALKADGTVVTWGYNTHGQGVTPPGLSNIVAISAGWYHNLAQHRDGTVAAWGLGTVNSGFPYFGQALVPPGLNNLAGIAGGGFFSMALRRDGTAVGWGRDDDYGQAAGTAIVANAVALAAGYDFGLALQSSAPLEVALSIQPLGSQLQLAWSGGVLQAADEIEGIYTDLDGAVSPLSITPSAARQFFRVRVQR